MANNFDPKDGGKVLRSDAEKWIKKFNDEDRHEKDKDTESIFFGKDFLRSILDENPDCAGISIFLSKKHSDHAQKDVINVVLIPRKADGTLIYSTVSDGKDVPLQYVWDTGKVCPPSCS
jgi:hypothetical protein